MCVFRRETYYIPCLCFISAENMDKKDEEMKEVIRKMWPVQSKKMLDLLVPPKEGKVL